MQQPKTWMGFEGFLAWDEGEARHELLHGRVHAMSPERLRHLERKGAVYTAFKDAVRASGVACSVLPDGATVPTSAGSAFRPDAMVRCGPKLGGDTQTFSDPLMVVEVASPGARHIDSGIKFAGCFVLPSMRHYLLTIRKAASWSVTAAKAGGSDRMSSPPARSSSLHRGYLSVSPRCSGGPGEARRNPSRGALAPARDPCHIAAGRLARGVSPANRVRSGRKQP